MYIFSTFCVIWFKHLNFKLNSLETIFGESKLEALKYEFVTLRQRPELKENASLWFHDKWKVKKKAYLDCINSYINHQTEYGWYLCLCNDSIVGGLGVVDNDFHERKDLSPNVCAIYVEPEHRNQGIAGQLLNYVVNDMKGKGIYPIYLITDHINFYEKYGWEFLCMVKEDNNLNYVRLYIHR